MLKVTAIFVLSALSLLVSAAPLEKRISQDTVAAKTAWEQACIKAGGGTQCNPIAVTAAGTLLRGAGDCEQQDSADAMIDLAKKLNNDPEMIRLAQLFVQQPRNAPDSLQVPYCQKAPKNAELNGLFHCQFAGSKFPNFSGDGSGTVPLGLTAVNPPGSCPAHPDGPVEDGVQLNTIVQDPGVGGAASSGNAGGAGAGADSGAGSGSGSSSGSGAGSGSGSGSGADSGTGGAGGAGANNGGSGAAAGNGAPAPAPSQSPATSSGSGAKPFVQQNGRDAQALNDKFATLTADSPCDDGENACVNGAFAQCVNGKFVLTNCSGGLVCAALPLVNSPGTSVTCTTTADRDARIASAIGA